MHPHIQKLLQCIDLEEKEQAERFRLDQQHSLKQLKAEGLVLHPVIVTRKNFGYADYPEIGFKLDFPPEVHLFKDGAAIECFIPGEEPVKGILISLDGRQGEFRLFAPDFPDWIEDDGLAIKLAPDTRTTAIMKKVLKDLPGNKILFELFQKLHGTATGERVSEKPGTQASFPETKDLKNSQLNKSQQEAVHAITHNEELTIVHGPPGTGKTTTLVEAIGQLVRDNKKILVSAPSNTALDHISRGLIKSGIKLLRVGNLSKVDETLFAHTPEGRMQQSKVHKEIKDLKIRAEEFRRMALKYKRKFGRAEKEQRNLLFQEVKNIRGEIKKIQLYHEERLFEEAEVIAGTPIGLHDAGLRKYTFHTLFIDEAGQCIEPLAWCIFPLATRKVLAGDHWQLPPTVLSNEAARLGFNNSILEVAMARYDSSILLNTQYRMREVIAGFSSRYFYKDLLQTATHLVNKGTHLVFIDTAGSGYEEEHGPDGVSFQNEGELDIAAKIIDNYAFDPSVTAFISPYSGQVIAAKDRLPTGMRLSTIDSFQGQEKENIILSLVRSNDESEIGFLKDYRRMNVAITRAREQLVVIGDSATIGADKFYNEFLSYVEQYGQYRTAWEFTD